MECRGYVICKQFLHTPNTEWQLFSVFIQCSTTCTQFLQAMSQHLHISYREVLVSKSVHKCLLFNVRILHTGNTVTLVFSLAVAPPIIAGAVCGSLIAVIFITIIWWGNAHKGSVPLQNDTHWWQIAKYSMNFFSCCVVYLPTSSLDIGLQFGHWSNTFRSSQFIHPNRKVYTAPNMYTCINENLPFSCCASQCGCVQLLQQEEEETHAVQEQRHRQFLHRVQFKRDSFEPQWLRWTRKKLDILQNINT